MVFQRAIALAILDPVPNRACSVIVSIVHMCVAYSYVANVLFIDSEHVTSIESNIQKNGLKRTQRDVQ